MEIADLLAFSVKNKASDLHLSAGLPPLIRVNGDIRRINVEPLEHKGVHSMVYDIMNDGQRKAYVENRESAHAGAIKLPADLQRTDPTSQRHRAGHRPDRLRQIHHLGGND